ncbi:signal peptidase I [Salsuginibacillus kocurii]|uniref:signal peptidase I n=1 Tax=Salsuginibacillus kocurii TaxID=427078 RepID=UPI00035D5926|nr:signal peptidase I [Salsuginibacillus kocurii]
MNSIGREIWDWIKTFAVVLLIVLIVRTFFFANYMVHGESMMPTIENGERLIINKIGYEWVEPDRFDLIVFHANEESDYIKRVIGTPGDEIEYASDQLYVNGEPYDEPYLDEFKDHHGGPVLTHDFTLEDILEKETVPDNHLFVLGDNRQNSLDSRQLGFVPYDKLVGKANLRYWPLGEISFVK